MQNVSEYMLVLVLCLVVDALEFWFVRGLSGPTRLAGDLMCQPASQACVEHIFRPYHSTMYAGAAFYRCSSVSCMSVYLSLMIVSPAKMAEPIEMPIGVWTGVGPRNHVMCGGPYPL